MDISEGLESAKEDASILAFRGSMVLADCVCKSLFGGDGLLGKDANIVPEKNSS